MAEEQSAELRSLEPLPEPIGLAAQQQRVYDILKEHSGEKWQFEKWYLGALQAIQEQRPDYLAQAANSIREIAEKLPEFAGVPKPESPFNKTKTAVATILKLKFTDYPKGWDGQSINPELARALSLFDDLQTLFDSPSRTRMLQAALEQRDRYSSLLSPELRRTRNQQFKNLGEFFQSVTHHQRIPSREVFLANVSSFENLILHYLSPVTASQQSEINEIIGSPPTPESEPVLRELLVHNSSNLLFFLTKLQDPLWLPFLEALGVFSQLREGEKTAEGDLVYGADPALSCLARLSPKAPRQALDILKKLPESPNPQIPNQVMRCIAGIEDPALISECLKLLQKVIKKPGHNDWVWIEEILKTWAKLNKTAEIIDLIGTYIRSHIRSQEDRYGAGTGWQFSEIDRDFVAPLVASHPSQLATMLFRALRFWKLRHKELSAANPTAIEKYFSESDAPLEQDPSTYWLEDFRSRTSHIHELEEILATRLFEIGSSIFTSGDEAAINDFDGLLRSDPWELFSRLRWQIYAEHPEKTGKLAKADVVARFPILSNYEGSHGYEMAQMLEAHSQAHGSEFLNPDEVTLFYENVMRGPIDHDGVQITDDYADRFRSKQLHPIRALLSGQAQETYKTLSKDSPTLPISSYKPFSSGGGARTIEQVAPKEAEGLATMPDDELWLFLNEWKPSKNRHESDQWWVEEHVSTLGLKFADLLESDPERFQASTAWWRNLSRPVVLYKPLEGATARIASEKKDDAESAPPSENEWRNWFGIAAWISEQSGALPSSGNDEVETARPEDRDWNWPRMIAVKFLTSTINPRFDVPEGLVPEIGRLLRKFVEDPDGRLASKDQPWMDDWLTTAINSVRGTAIEELLSLALNQKKASPSGEPEAWIFDVIRNSLSSEDQSPAVFAIMGARLNLVLFLYGEQFKQEPGLLLPRSRIAHRNAFILAQVRYGNALGQLLDTLPTYASAALECLGVLNMEASGDNERGDFGGRLGTQLAWYYWNDCYPNPEVGEATLDRYFDTAKPSQRARAIGDIARIFSDEKPAADHELIYQRVRDLWDRRLAVIEERRSNKTYTSDDVEPELSAFVKWLGCECHPFGWRHDRVLRALKILDTPVQPAFTMRTLESLSRDPEKLAACTEILEALLSKEIQIVSWAYRESEMKPILVRGLGTENTAIKERTLRIQEIILRHGLFEYLDLTSQSEVDS